MTSFDRDSLQSIKRFDQLVKYLRDELNWPIDGESFDDLTFDYEPEELGIDMKTAAKIQEIKQLRPLISSQPWGIFFVKFEPKRLPVVALRRLLSKLVIKRRASSHKAEQPAWHLHDLLFISNYGEGEQRQITFAHFSQDESKDDLPTLKVLGWDNLDTPLHIDHVAEILTERLVWPSDGTDTSRWRESWGSAFTLRHREVITTSKDLATRLAMLARAIRDRIRTVLAIETKNGSVTKLMKAFQEALVHDLDADGFADMYAQTITYGLLSARITNPKANTADGFTDQIPITNPFLKELMETFLHIGGRKGRAGQGPGIDFDELGVSEVVELLDDANMEAVIRDFGDRNPQEDPIIHFYEDFVKQYDKSLWKGRGVIYTPRPVVSYIVRSVHELLQTEFGLKDGLADTGTWGEMAERYKGLTIPEGVKTTDRFVTILDIATGTGTFLVEVIDVIHRTVVDKWNREGHSEKKILDLWNDYVPTHLLPRLHGYELLMAPYAIAHLKIGLKLYETGYRFGSDERVRIYLTNALETAQDFSGKFEFMIPALAHEAQAVNEVKRHQRFTVVIGNPPYSNFGQLNKILFVQNLLEDYKRGLDEKKINLDDDFIKFVRYSHNIIDNVGTGILGFITNNTYFDGITHRQMRQHIIDSMPRIWIIDLHGSASKKERAPDGSKDENVFDIQQGVGISLWSKAPKQFGKTEIAHTSLWGLRQDKYNWLQKNSLGTTTFTRLKQTTPYQFFVPKDFDLAAEYERGYSLLEVFNVNANGIKTDRDGLFFSDDINELKTRIKKFYSSEGTKEPYSSLYRVEDSSSYPLLKRRAQTRFDEKCIHRCLYRPFDTKWIYYAVGLTSRPAWDVMRYMQSSRSLGLLAMRQYEYNVPEYCYFLATRSLTECRVFISNRGIVNCFPLYLISESKGQQIDFPSGDTPQNNFRVEFLRDLSIALNLQRKNKQEVNSDLTPEDVFDYAYAIFHSPNYRRRYEAFLKIDFPRLPLTSSIELFRKLAKLGDELVTLHLMELPTLIKYITTIVGSGESHVEKVSYSAETVWIDKARTRGFRGVPEAVWNFHIGGYQVLHKWLKDRKGRTLSDDDINHYQKIVVALSETIRIMREIDKVIEEHGGWPDAFNNKKV